MSDVTAAAGRRWLMWGIPALVFLIAFLHRAAPGVIAKDLMQAFGMTGAAVGLLSAMYFYSYAGFMVPGGLLIDSVGPRWVIAGGGLVMGLGSLAMGLAGSPVALFVGRLLVGLGATVTFTGALKIAANWFPPSQFGMMSALTATVGVLGALIGSAPLAALAAGLSWRGALIIVGAVTVAGALLCAALVRDRPASGPAAAPRGGSLREMMTGMVQVLRNPYTWPPFLCFFFLYAAMGNFFLWSVPFLRDVYGLTTTRAALYASLPSMALLASAPFTGYLSDRVLRRRKLPYTVLASGQFLVWLAFVLTLGTLPLPGVCLLFLLHGRDGRRLRPHLAARGRGEPARARRHRGGGDQPRRLRGRRPHPGPDRGGARRGLDGRDGRGRARLPGRVLPRRLRALRALRPARGRDHAPASGDAGDERPPPAPAGSGRRGKRAP